MANQTKTNKDNLSIVNPIDREKIKTQIYTIRGQRVMLDSDIAVYYGVTTGNLNKAMKRNQKRFPDRFCFQLTKDEYYEILRFQSGILELEQGKYSKYPPYVYTEHGVTMLTSVLHTERAIHASIQIVEVFVEMTHYIQQNSHLFPYQEIQRIEARQTDLESEVADIKENMVTKTDLSEFMRLFDQGRREEEVLILDGEPFKADLAYQKIYRKAKKNITVVDDYLGVKTLHHLAHAKTTVSITIVSDNKGNQPLRKAEYDDFITEYPKHTISFIRAMKRAHDRYIVVDQGTKDMKVYHCGASSKDAGRRITTITRIVDISDYKKTIQGLLKNPPLQLR